MTLHSPNLSTWFSTPIIRLTPAITPTRDAVNLAQKFVKMASSSVTCNAPKTSKESVQDLPGNDGGSGFCATCRRRHFVGAVLGTGLLPGFSSFAAGENLAAQESTAILNRIHPPRPDWYEEFYALALDKTMKSYEAEIAGYKSQLFANLRGKAEKILEIGIGTAPNLKYYADCPGIDVYGVDPNRKMEKYARAAAERAGLPPSNFRFTAAVAEALPLNDASVDAVVGTLVLCSVEDVDGALQEVRRVLKPGGLYIFIEHVAAKDGTILRFVQGILDPLQETVADGCHLTRNTTTNIARAGFSSLEVNQAVLSSASLINPHVYGIAGK